MRRQILNLTVPFIILVLTLSFVAVLPVLPVTGQDTGKIKSKLEELRGKVEDVHPPALENKVNAVIHQVEAGAFNGAINKLQNDVKKSIVAWVDNPEERLKLLKLVDEIIDLIKGITPPPPPIIPDFEISTPPYPLEVVQGSYDTTIITVTSKNNFNQEVVLIATTTASGVTLSFNQSTIVPPRNGTVASELNVNASLNATPGDDFEITVTATSSGFEPKEVEIKLKVIALTEEIDKTPPTIASVQRSPETPAYNESVEVTAFVYDTESGVKQVILNYSSGSAWTPVVMILSEGLYQADIPAFPFDTSVQYRVHALDNENNLATSDPFSYKVIDPYLPLLRIDKPTQGSYLSGTVAITVFMKDQNSGGESGFASAELSINGTVVKTWEPPAPSEPDTYNWNTSAFGADGVYIVKLAVRDKAGNIAEKSLTVTVDNTLPTAAINTPAAGSYLRLSVLIKVIGSDTNFDKMEVRIDNDLVRTSFTSGSEVLEWNTRSYGEGVHSITLTVFDKAGNIKQALINVTVDNTPPLIGTPSWSPKEPAAKVDIQINVTVTEPTYGSGVNNVTLWFKNTTMDDWQFISMELKAPNWTVVLRGQSDTKVKFFIEAFDRAGNRAEKERFEFAVAGPAGFPLAWILVAIAIILAGSGGAAYYLRRRQKKGKSASSAPAISSTPAPPPEPSSLPARKPPRRRSQREFKQLMDTLLNDKNAPKVDYSKYINA